MEVMKKLLLVLLTINCLFTTIVAQTKEKENKVQPKGKSNSISTGFDIPLGKFSDTHSFGGGIDYSWSNHRFGKMDITPQNPFGFIVNTGGDYYTGKKETIGIYAYDYPSYINLHTYCGVIYNSDNKVNINLTAGPTLGIYSGTADFGLGANLSGNYYLNKNIAITPVLVFMNNFDAVPFWVVSIRVSYVF
jgi:hypothetical protein